MKYAHSIPSGRKRNETACSSSYDFSKKIRELRIELEMRKREEERIEKDISLILDENSIDGVEQNRSFGMAVTKFNNKMLVVENSAKQLTNSLKSISILADSISGRVSALDVAKTRVVNCLQLAGDMRDLGLSAEGVDDAIRAEDFEAAADHIHRFLTLDKAVFQIRNFKDTTDSIRHNYDILTTAKERLSKILKAKMDKAVEGEDIGAMQRFVKLFPKLNEHEEGLNRFAIHLSRKIDKLGEDNFKIMKAGGMEENRRNVLYADTLFMFFEGIADVIESNLPMLESSYGMEKLIDLVFTLQKRIDDFFEKVFSEFEKKRSLKTLIHQIDSAEKPDSNEIDVLLVEMCMMNTHVEMYWRFLRRRIGKNTDDGISDSRENDEISEEELQRIEELKKKRKEEKERKLDQLFNRSLVGVKMQELICQYILLEHYYMEKSSEKAIEMDQKEDETQLTSSLPDDLVFIVRKCIRRAAGSGNVDSVCATINNAVALLDTTIYSYFADFIQTDYSAFGFATDALQSAQTAYNAYQQGKSVKDAHESQKNEFLMAVNNCMKLSSLLKDLQHGLNGEWSGKKRADVEKNKLEHSTTQIEDVARKLEHLARHGIEELFKATFKPSIKASCDSYRDISHQLSMQDLEHFEANDPFMEQFLAKIDKLFVAHENILLPENYQTLLMTVCGEVAKQIESAVLKCQFNRFGTLQLDRELRQFTAYLTNVAGWSAREKSSRLASIVALLNVETVDEAVEVWENSKTSSTVLRPLTLAEVRKVLAVRVDLSPAAIKAIGK